MTVVLLWHDECPEAYEECCGCIQCDGYTPSVICANFFNIELCECPLGPFVEGDNRVRTDECDPFLSDGTVGRWSAGIDDTINFVANLIFNGFDPETEQCYWCGLSVEITWYESPCLQLCINSPEDCCEFIEETELQGRILVILSTQGAFGFPPPDGKRNFTLDAFIDGGDYMFDQIFGGDSEFLFEEGCTPDNDATINNGLGSFLCGTSETETGVPCREPPAIRGVIAGTGGTAKISDCFTDTDNLLLRENVVHNLLLSDDFEDILLLVEEAPLMEISIASISNVSMDLTVIEPTEISISFGSLSSFSANLTVTPAAPSGDFNEDFNEDFN